MPKKKTKKKNEDINIPVKIGDTILTGRFKNKKVVVKSIDDISLEDKISVTSAKISYEADVTNINND